MTFSEWLAFGISQNWVGPVVCETHDGLPTSAEEEELFWESDPCIEILRVYNSEEHRKAVEDHHTPSCWSKSL
jgi:hypothetical protein